MRSKKFPLKEELHPWVIEPEKAREIQRKLASKVDISGGSLPPLEQLNYIAGTDIGFKRDNLGELSIIRAVVVVLQFPSLKLVERTIVEEPVPMPYIPGLLSFRELPSLLKAFANLSLTPDLILVDGQGVLHPRGLGNGSHLGVWLDRPTIGVAERRLSGFIPSIHEKIDAYKNSTGGQRIAYIYSDEEAFDRKRRESGLLYHSKKGSNPLYISPGHKINLEEIESLLPYLFKGYKLPEPIRIADSIASKRRGFERWLKDSS